MPSLGDTVIYTVPVEHETKTVRGGETLLGSVHHPMRRTFAGVIGHVYPDGSADIELKIPNRQPKWVEAVTEGVEPGQFLLGGQAGTVESIAQIQAQQVEHAKAVTAATANAAAALTAAEKALAAVSKPTA